MPDEPEALPGKAISGLKLLAEALARSDWEALEGMGACSRVPVEDLRRVLDENGIGLAEHPESAWPKCLDIYPTVNPGLWLVDLALWGPEGETDLTLQLSVSRSAGSVFSLTINDLRVL